MELRCTAKKFAELLHPSDDEGIIEVRCTSRWCGSTPGVVVLHKFSTSTGKLVETNRYRQPPIGGANGPDNHPPAVRA